MKLFGDVSVIRGSIGWAGFLRPRERNDARLPLAAAPQREFDEDGRLYVFRYPRSQPQRCSIDFDRVFDYMKRRRLPSEAHRRFRRDAENSVDIHALPQ